MKKFLSLILLCATTNQVVASRDVISQGSVSLTPNLTASWQASVPGQPTPQELALQALQQGAVNKQKRHKDPVKKAVKKLTKKIKKLF